MNTVRPRNPVSYLKYRYLEWRWDRVLKKSGCKTWEAYFRRNDPDFNYAGKTVNDQLFGYPYVALAPFRHLEMDFDPMWGEVFNGESMAQWCRQHCRGKFRWQWERVIMDHSGQYAPNGIGGMDELFFGFKDERDYFLFLLRWS